jgi:predicted nuclease of predicted toxin-antitoxin system
MLFKIDENLPIEVAELLRGDGHDAYTVFEQELSGASDIHVSQICQAEGRILITLDIDFADIRTYPPQNYPGLVVLRLKQQDKPTILALILQILPRFKTEPIMHRLWIVDPNRIRIRK